MKKIFTLVALSLFTMSVFAQNTHLLFNNVPIDGQLQDFTQALQASGMNYVKTVDGKAIFSGAVAGFENCTVEAYMAPKSGLVFSVILALESRTTWQELKSDYEKMKASLTAQYGQPADVVEQFISEDGSVDSRMTDVANGAYAWHCSFITNEGVLTLSVAAENSNSGYVAVNYSDKQNVAAMRK